MDAKKKDWIISMLLNMTILTFPFLIALVYEQDIQERTLTLAVAMYVMTVAIGSTDKILFYIFFLLSLFLAATYGAIPYESIIEGLWHYQFLIVLFASIALGVDKYDLHVRKGQPLNNF